LAGKIFPRKFLRNTDNRLNSASIALSAEEYLGIVLLLSAILGAVVVILAITLSAPFPPLLAAVAFAGTFICLTHALPYYLAQRKARDLERVLPDALRQMASTFRAGVGIDAAMEDISRSGYGALSQEFSRAVAEIRRGRSLEDSLVALARRSNSPLFKRAFHLIIEGVRRGAALADVLDAVSNDAQEVQSIQRERRAATTQQVLFLVAAALFAAPMISGIVVSVGSIFTTINASSSVFPPELSTIVMFYLMIQAFITAIGVGIVRYGRASKGLALAPIFIPCATVVFFLARIAVEAII